MKLFKEYEIAEDIVEKTYQKMRMHRNPTIAEYDPAELEDIGRRITQILKNN